MRRAYIDKFISELEPWELLYARKRIGRSGPIPGFAWFEDLPPELLLDIATYLGLGDLLRCFQVSKVWRRKWMADDVLRSLSRRIFPGLVESKDGQLSLAEAFTLRSRRYQGRHDGSRKYHNYIRMNWDASWTTDIFPNIGDRGTNYSSALGRGRFDSSGYPVVFQEGMLAWQPDSSLCIIDDFRLRQRRMCALGSLLQLGSIPQVLAVTRKLVVLAIPQMQTSTSERPSLVCRELRVYDFESEGWRRITLPGRLAKIYARGDTLIITTLQSQVLIWTTKGQTKDIPVNNVELCAGPPNSKAALGGIPGVLFHSIHLDVFYLVWSYSSTLATERQIFYFVVVKYQNYSPTERFEQTYDAYFYDGSTPADTRCFMRFVCEPVNSHGLYSLGLARHLTPQSQREQHYDDTHSIWIKSVCFNALTERFSIRSYGNVLTYLASYYGLGSDNRSPWYTDRESDILLAQTAEWNDQLLYTIFTPKFGWPQDEVICHGAKSITDCLKTTESQLTGGLGVHWHAGFESFIGPWINGVFADDDFIVVTTCDYVIVYPFAGHFRDVPDVAAEREGQYVWEEIDNGSIPTFPQANAMRTVFEERREESVILRIP